MSDVAGAFIWETMAISSTTLPKRPPGLHCRTYQHLCDEIHAATDVAFLAE